MLSSLVSRLAASGAYFVTSTCYHRGQSNIDNVHILFPAKNPVPLNPNLPEAVRDKGPMSNDLLTLIESDRGSVEAIIHRNSNGLRDGVEEGREWVDGDLAEYVGSITGLAF